MSIFHTQRHFEKRWILWQTIRFNLNNEIVVDIKKILVWYYFSLKIKKIHMAIT